MNLALAAPAARSTAQPAPRIIDIPMRADNDLAAHSAAPPRRNPPGAFSPPRAVSRLERRLGIQVIVSEAAGILVTAAAPR